MRTRSTVRIAAGLLLCFAASARAAHPELRFYAASGTPAPGTPHNFFRLASGEPTVSQAGTVAIPAEAGASKGLWTVDPLGSSQLGLWAYGNQPISGGLPGDTWSVTPYTNFDDQGRATGSPGSTNVFFGDSGNLTTVLRGGTPAIGVPGGILRSDLFGDPGISRNGIVVCYASVQTGSPSHIGTGVWTRSPGGPTVPVAVPFMQAPGLVQGAVFSEVRASAINNDGVTAMAGTLRGTGVTLESDNFVARGSAGNLSILLREGQALAPGWIFDRAVGIPAMNPAADVAFWTAADSGTQQTVSVIRGGGVSVLARTGQSGPGMQPGEVWTYSSGHVFWYPVINAPGDVGFWGQFRQPGGPLLSGVWVGDEADLRLVARSGSPIAGFPGLEIGRVADTFCLNAPGDVVMSALLAGAGVTSSNDDAIVWSSPGGVLEVILRQGDMLEIGPGVIKQIQSFEFVRDSGGSDGRMMSLNDLRVFTAEVGFTDGTSAVLVTVLPAPGALPVLGLAVAGAARRARRDR